MLPTFVSPLAAFLKSEDGPTVVEIAVLLALIIVVCASALTSLGANANKPSATSPPRSAAPARNRPSGLTRPPCSKSEPITSVRHALGQGR
jgi:pilus assembly protein Flp/PilA